VRIGKTIHRSFLASFSLLAFAILASPAEAQVTDVVVGVTPTCPYGISACWSGAYAALGGLKGVEAVAKSPDTYNCTAQVLLKNDGLPDPAAWSGQFKSAAGEVYGFRGVEVTVEGTLEGEDENLALRVPGVQQPIRLSPLRDKLQWNFKKAAARQPEPDERDALAQLALKKKDAKGGLYKVEVTGPLKNAGEGYVLEVREFIPMNAGGDPKGSH